MAVVAEHKRRAWESWKELWDRVRLGYGWRQVSLDTKDFLELMEDHTAARLEIENLKSVVQDLRNATQMNNEEFQDMCASLAVRPSNCCRPNHCALAPFHEINLLREEKKELERQLESVSLAASQT